MKDIVNILITKRDIALMRWINSMGFVTIDCIAEKLNIAKSTAYGRARKLVAHNYISHKRIVFDGPGIYTLTHKGVSCCGSDLPPLRNIAKGTYDHNLIVTRLSLKLQKQHGGDFISERELQYQKNKDGKIGKYGHVADGELVIKNKRILIEVELALKGKKRLKEIMTEHMKNFDIDEVWYFCGSKRVKQAIAEYQSTCSFLKVYDLKDYLPTRAETTCHD